jgi:hypothetical protein
MRKKVEKIDFFIAFNEYFVPGHVTKFTFGRQFFA